MRCPQSGGFRAVVVLVAAATLAGCSTTVTSDGPRYSDAEYPNGKELVGRVAVGGVVLREGVRIHHSEELPEAGLDLPGQADTWAPILEAAIHDRWGSPLAMPYWRFADEVAAKNLDRLLALYAAGRRLPEDLLATLVVPDGPRYLLMVRVEGDEVDMDSITRMKDSIPLTLQNGSSRGSTWDVPDASGGTETGPYGVCRTVRVTADLYDLQEARSLRTIRLKAERTGDGAAPPSDQAIAVIDSTAARHPFYDPVDPWVGRGPRLDAVLRVVFFSLVPRMLPNAPAGVGP